MKQVEYRTCSIEGCRKPHCARGWCKNHYQRWCKHGDPLGGRTPEGEPLAFLENIVLSFDCDDCLPWPFSRDTVGYGLLWRDGKLHKVHRIVCEIERGPPPTPEHVAAHNCGKGHLGCCNRKHLEWKTPKENEADKLVHGTCGRGERNGRAKLTERDVLEIRASTRPHRALAGEFRVSHTTVRKIRSGKLWGWL